MSDQPLVYPDSIFKIKATKYAFGTSLVINGVDVAPRVVAATITIRINEPTHVVLELIGLTSEIEGIGEVEFVEHPG